MAETLQNSGFAKILGLNPNVSPANPTASTSVTINGCKLSYSVVVNTGSPLNYNVNTSSGSWGIYDDMKSKITSTSGVSATLSDSFGKLGKAAQTYLTKKGFGKISMEAGAVSFDPDTHKLTLNAFEVVDVNKIGYVPYAKPYTTTQSVTLSKTVDLDDTFKTALAFVLVLALVYLWEVVGLAAILEVLTALGAAGLNRLTTALNI